MSSSAQLKRLYQLAVSNIVAIVAVPFAASALLKAAELGPEELLARLRALRPVHMFLTAFIPPSRDLESSQDGLQRRAHLHGSHQEPAPGHAQRLARMVRIDHQVCNVYG